MSVELDLPDDLKMLREMVRRFVDQELIPLEGKSLNGADLKPDVEAVAMTATDFELLMVNLNQP